MALQDLPRAGLGRDPVPGPDPAGESIRYEEEFTRLEDEIGKLQTAGPAAVDWPAVVDMADEILANRSKDLLVASWLTFALHRQDGLAGLADGLGVVRGIVETYWDDCFPPLKRMRARVGAVEWIAERVGPALGDVTATADNADAIVTLFELVDELDRTVSEKADGAQANLGELLRPLRNLKRDADFIREEAARKAAAADEAARQAAEVAAAAAPGDAAAADESAATATPDAAAPAPAQAAAAPAPAPAPTPAPAPAAVSAAPAQTAPIPQAAAVAVPGVAGPEMDRAVNALRGNAIAMAKSIRAANPGDPRAYQLLRGVLWLSVHGAPPDQGGQTMLPDPTGELGPVLAKLSQAGDPVKLLEFCETNAVDRLFWLDLHRHAAAALEALGHGDARNAVVAHTAAFLKRFPTVTGLAFQNGTAFADPATRMWIGDELLPAGGGTGGGDGLGADLDAARSEARALAGKGKLGDAAAIFEQSRTQAVGDRTRFLWDIEKARLCVDAGRGDLALALLLHLDKMARKVSLDTWDPSLCIDLTILLLRCDAEAATSGSDPGRAALRQEWETRLSRLDMRAAVELVRAPAGAATG